jgi:Transcription factor TFIIH complex subunit Tfb5
MVQAMKGVLISSDEATIVYLTYLDEIQVGLHKFILYTINSRSILVKPDKLQFIRDKLAERLAETTFDDDDEDGNVPILAQP